MLSVKLRKGNRGLEVGLRRCSFAVVELKFIPKPFNHIRVKAGLRDMSIGKIILYKQDLSV